MQHDSARVPARLRSVGLRTASHVRAISRLQVAYSGDTYLGDNARLPYGPPIGPLRGLHILNGTQAAVIHAKFEKNLCVNNLIYPIDLSYLVHH